MTNEDILRLRDTAEQTRVQFKERVTRDNKYDVSCEMVALRNTDISILDRMSLLLLCCKATCLLGMMSA